MSDTFGCVGSNDWIKWPPLIGSQKYKELYCDEECPKYNVKCDGRQLECKIYVKD